MKQHSRVMRLSRETVRHLGDTGRGRPDGPIGTEPNTELPNHCLTASCRPHIC